MPRKPKKRKTTSRPKIFNKSPDLAVTISKAINKAQTSKSNKVYEIRTGFWIRRSKVIVGAKNKPEAVKIAMSRYGDDFDGLTKAEINKKIRRVAPRKRNVSDGY